MSLRKQAIHGVKWTTVSAIIAAGTQLIQVAVLAHFLDKRDFGLMALALVVISLSQIFIDMGISNAIIHKQDVTHTQLSSLYWLNVFLGIIIFFLLFLIAPVAAKFYKEPELGPIINWVGLTFIIQPFGQQYEVLLKKQLKFKSLAIRDVFSKIAGLIIAVVLAYYNYGVYALVFGNLSAAVVSTALLIYPGTKIHKPALIFDFHNIKAFLGFGMFQMGEKFVNYFNSQFDTIIIGKLLGVEALGVYNIAKIITFKPYQVINPIITKVSFPIMARAQNDLKKIKKIYLTTIRFLSSIIAPLYLFMFVFSEPIILIVFGNEWRAAILIMRLLALAGLFTSVLNPVGSLQLALGRADLGFYWNFSLLFFIPLSIWLGSFWGLIGVAFSILILRFALMIISWKFMIYPLSKAAFFDYFSNIFSPFIIATIAAASSLLVLFLLNSNLLQLLIGGFIFVASYLLLSLLFNKFFLLELMDFANIKWKHNEVSYPLR